MSGLSRINNYGDYKKVPDKMIISQVFNEGLDKGGYGPKSDKQIQILFKLIDLCKDPKGIFLDWDNKYVSKQNAKKYIIKANKE